RSAILWPRDSELGHLLEVEDLDNSSRELGPVPVLRCENINKRRIGALQRARALSLSSQSRPTKQRGLGNQPRGPVEPSQRCRRRIDDIPGLGRKHELLRERIGQESLPLNHLVRDWIWPNNWD